MTTPNIHDLPFFLHTDPFLGGVPAGYSHPNYQSTKPLPDKLCHIYCLTNASTRNGLQTAYEAFEDRFKKVATNPGMEISMMLPYITIRSLLLKAIVMLRNIYN